MRSKTLKRPQAVDGPGSVEHTCTCLDQETAALVQLGVGLDPEVLEEDAEDCLWDDDHVKENCVELGGLEVAALVDRRNSEHVYHDTRGHARQLQHFVLVLLFVQFQGTNLARVLSGRRNLVT